jgi:hypothetical protein
VFAFATLLLATEMPVFCAAMPAEPSERRESKSLIV